MISYIVEESAPFTVKVFNTEVSEDVPFIYQPHDEFGVDWESFTAAEDWAKLYVQSFNENASVVMSEEEIIKSKLAAAGLSLEDIISFLESE